MYCSKSMKKKSSAPRRDVDKSDKLITAPPARSMASSLSTLSMPSPGRGIMPPSALVMPMQACVLSDSAIESSCSDREMADEDMDAAMTRSFDEYDGEIDQLAAPRQLYQEPPKTKEYEERNYYLHTNDPLLVAPLVPINRYWADYANYLLNKTKSTSSSSSSSSPAFLSRNFLFATSSFSEMVFAMSVLDLPFVDDMKSHENVGSRDKSLQFKAGTPCILFHREMKDTQLKNNINSKLSVKQYYYDPNDLYDEGEEEQIDKYIVDEFLPSHIYGGRVVITNLTSSRQKVEALIQIPEGAMPISMLYSNKRGISTHTLFFELTGFGSHVVDYMFYFPTIGQYLHYPVQLCRKHMIIAYAPNNPILKAVLKSTVDIDKNSWKYIANDASMTELTHFLMNRNLLKVNLEDIAWRCRENKQDFETIIGILSKRMVYSPAIYSYILYHNIKDITNGENILKAYLSNNAGQFGFGNIPYFNCPYFSYDTQHPTINTFQHLEYSPLINSRAHVLTNIKSKSNNVHASSAAATQIQNREFRIQYDKFLNYLLSVSSSFTTLSSAQQLALVYYLLLQDRVEEAQKLFAQITPSVLPPSSPVSSEANKTSSSLLLDDEDVNCRVQYDYFTAYFDLFNVPPTIAPTLVKTYEQYPVLKVRKLFSDLNDQLKEMLNELDIQAYKIGEEKEEREKELSNLASTESSVDVQIKSTSILVQYSNCSKLQVNFYKMEVEMMFSTNPFQLTENTSTSTQSQHSHQSLLYVSPNHSILLNQLNSGKGQQIEVAIPDEYLPLNVYVEVVNVGSQLGVNACSCVKPRYANQLTVQLLSNYGQVKVLHSKSGKPLSQVYVKVYCKDKQDKSVNNNDQ